MKPYLLDQYNFDGSSHLKGKCIRLRAMFETKLIQRVQLRKVTVIMNALHSALCISKNVRLFKGAIDDVLNPTEYERIKWYVLHNCDEMLPYIKEHEEELKRQNIRNICKEQEIKFAEWFLRHVQQMQEEESTEDIESLLNLGIGPNKSVARYSGCIINGIRFHTRDREENKRTQNSGVVVKGEHRGKSIKFYGVLTDIIELSYLGENRVLFSNVIGWTLLKKREYRLMNTNS